jgi:hypothetical protein
MHTQVGNKYSHSFPHQLPCSRHLNAALRPSGFGPWPTAYGLAQSDPLVGLPRDSLHGNFSYVRAPAPRTPRANDTRMESSNLVAGAGRADGGLDRQELRGREGVRTRRRRAMKAVRARGEKYLNGRRESN